jgi:hypothetical protein
MAKSSDLATSLQGDRHSLGNESHSLDNEKQLLHIASPARLKKRLPSQEMRKIILVLCRLLVVKNSNFRSCEPQPERFTEAFYKSNGSREIVKAPLS